MRLGTLIAPDGAALPVVENAGVVHALDALLGRPVPSLVALMDDWTGALAQIDAALPRAGAPLETAGYRFAAPVPAPRKVICIGINYRDHIAEMGASLPEYPYAFLRPPLCLTGHEAEIALPAWPELVDWEAELAVIIGTTARDLTPDTALDAVAGYTLANDVSARDWIARPPFVGIDWVMQKAWDSFQPTGPWLTPARDIADPQAIDLTLTVNGVVKQAQSTAQMVFSVREILVHLSRIMTLEPGDVIATGTPAGVGYGRTPREVIRPGDVVTVESPQLGRLSNRFTARPGA